MGTKYQRCPAEVQTMADEILVRYPTHKPLIEAGVRIDFVFAYAPEDAHGSPVGCALKLHGCRALGICRKISLKHRALGRGDAEISLDGDWWGTASLGEREALLDHELTHVEVIRNAETLKPLLDDLNRPKVRFRPHDFEFGWFTQVAMRHGIVSAEVRQAKQIMDEAGQFYWPGLAMEEPTAEAMAVPVTHRKGDIGKWVTVDADAVEKAAARLRNVSEKENRALYQEETPAQGEDEALIQQCVEVIRTEQKASVSLLQRRLRLGYTRAARIMDELERRGVVGPAKGAEPRDILLEKAA